MSQSQIRKPDPDKWFKAAVLVCLPGCFILGGFTAGREPGAATWVGISLAATLFLAAIWADERGRRKVGSGVGRVEDQYAAARRE